MAAEKEGTLAAAREEGREAQRVAVDAVVVSAAKAAKDWVARGVGMEVVVAIEADRQVL